MSVTFSILADENRINVVTNDYVHIGDFFPPKVAGHTDVIPYLFVQVTLCVVILFAFC